MNQRQAFLDTVDLAAERGMQEIPGSPLGLEHLREMSVRVQWDDFSDAKIGRWLGWAQCAVVAADIGVTLDDMKRINRLYSEEEQ